MLSARLPIIASLGVRRYWGCGTVCLFVLLVLSGMVAFPTTAAPNQSVSVADLVRQAKFGDPGDVGYADESDGSPPAVVSPDKSRAVVLMRFGDPEHLRNVGRIYLITVQKNQPPRKRLLAERYSVGNQQPVALVRWSADSRNILFTASDSNGRPQVFRLNTESRRSRQITQESNLQWYSANDVGDVVLASNRPPGIPVSQATCKVVGCRIDATTLWGGENGITQRTDLFSAYDRTGRRTATIVRPEESLGEIESCQQWPLSEMSSDGRFAVAVCELRAGKIPPFWDAYAQKFNVRDWFVLQAKLGGSELVLLDLASGQIRKLTDKPFLKASGKIAWDAEGSKLYIAGALCATNDSGLERCVLQIDLHTGAEAQVGLIKDLQYAIGVSWDAPRAELTIEYADPARSGHSVVFKEIGTSWTVAKSVELASTARPDLQLSDGTTITVDQSYSQPPRLMLHYEGREIVALSPDSWLSTRVLSRLEPVEWTLKDGRGWQGLLIYPGDYKAGQRYPLLIQTHGEQLEQFDLDGGLTTNYPGQALASRGFFVLQIADHQSGANRHEDGSAEWSTILSSFQSAIGFLADRGYVDPSRVGIIGWSRSGWQESFALTHDPSLFAAAAFGDAGLFGPFGYPTVNVEVQEEMDASFGEGKPPYGSGVSEWAKWSPGMNLDKVITPTIMWETVSVSTYGLWDWYSALRRFGIPVEYWVLPQGAHVLYDVAQRLKMNALTIDWFCFWLNDQEDPDPERAAQYARWRKMRAEFQVNMRTSGVRGTRASTDTTPRVDIK